MGGCCCCPHRDLDQRGTPTYYYCPTVSEEHQPLSADHGATSGFTTGLLVDADLDTSTPDTYKPPPTPLPYGMDTGHYETPDMKDFSGDKNTAAGGENGDSVEGIMGGISKKISVEFDGLKLSDCKGQSHFDDVVKQPEVELSKPSEPLVASLEDDDVCPTCLEEYDAENPKIVSACDHHFHLSCILEWMERQDTCPVCEKEMIFNPPISE